MLTHHLKQLDTLDLEQVEFQLDQHTRSRKKGGQLSWSFSRYRLFNRCKRQYYLHYYASQRVRTANDAAVSAAWWLKQLTPVRAWIGSVVHRAARRLVESLQDGAPLPEQELVDYALALFNDGADASARQRKSSYSRWVLLAEDAYHTTYDAEHARSNVAQFTAALVHHPALQLIIDANAVLENDNAFQSFTVNVPTVGDVAVYAVPDVLIEASSGRAVIIDWKSGAPKPEDMRIQASTYSFYTHRLHQFSEEAIRAVFAILDDPALLWAETDPLTDTQALITNSIQEMAGLLIDQDYQTVTIEDFPMTDDLVRCQTCSFRRICWRHEEA